MATPIENQLIDAMQRMLNAGNVFAERRREFEALPRWKQDEIRRTNEARAAAAAHEANLRRLALDAAVFNVSGWTAEQAWCEHDNEPTGCHCGCGCC